MKEKINKWKEIEGCVNKMKEDYVDTQGRERRLLEITPGLWIKLLLIVNKMMHQSNGAPDKEQSSQGIETPKSPGNIGQERRIQKIQGWTGCPKVIEN